MIRQNSEKPRIAVIGLKGLPAYGGSARAGENMMFFLKDEFSFVVFNTDTHTYRTTGVFEGIEQIVFKKFFMGSMNTIYYYLRSALFCLFRGGFDVVHVFHVDAAFIVPLLRLRYRVVSAHRARPQFADKWSFAVKQYFRLMEWIFFKLPADVVTSVSKPVADLFRKRTRREILYIPNGIVFRDEEELPQIDEKNYILFASGRIIEAKGAHVMLEALKKTGYNGRVLIIGNRNHAPEYSRKLESYSNTLDIRFIDIIKEKRLLMAYLRNARMFVFPSFHEGMSNMLLEAVSMKVPVVCSDISENRHVFNDHEVLFFKSRDSDDLAEKILYVLEHKQEAYAMALRGYERLKKDYDWANISRRYAAIYWWLIKYDRPLNREEKIPDMRK